MTTTQILKILNIAAWVLFIGLCIRTGAMLISFIVSLSVNPVSSTDLYMGINLVEILEFSRWHYLAMAGLIIILSGLKAYLFYWVVKTISELNVSHPFSEHITGHISKMSFIALLIGITAILTAGYADWLMQNQLHFTYEAGGSEFLFLAGILFVIAVIFKRGIELQTENELTI